MGLIADYTSLQTELLSFLDRDDITANLSLLIQMGEQRIYRDVRVRAMEATLNVTLSAGVAAVPSDYVALKNAHILYSSRRYTLKHQDSQYIGDHYPNRTAESMPKFLAREAGKFIFGPYPDQNYSLRGIYFKRLAALSGSNTSNWFTTDAPDLLLWACLSESEGFLVNDDRIQLWEAKYDKTKNVINKEYKRERTSGGPTRSVPG